MASRQSRGFWFACFSSTLGPALTAAAATAAATAAGPLVVQMSGYALIVEHLRHTPRLAANEWTIENILAIQDGINKYFANPV